MESTQSIAPFIRSRCIARCNSRMHIMTPLTCNIEESLRKLLTVSEVHWCTNVCIINGTYTGFCNSTRRMSIGLMWNRIYISITLNHNTSENNRGNYQAIFIVETKRYECHDFFDPNLDNKGRVDARNRTIESLRAQFVTNSTCEDHRRALVFYIYVLSSRIDDLGFR